jgi:hypothetical protein
MSEAARKLQKTGLIDYPRGHIKVLNREGLEEISCECYAVVKKEYDRLLPAKVATQLQAVGRNHRRPLRRRIYLTLCAQTR